MMSSERVMIVQRKTWWASNPRLWASAMTSCNWVWVDSWASLASKARETASRTTTPLGLGRWSMELRTPWLVISQASSENGSSVLVCTDDLSDHVVRKCSDECKSYEDAWRCIGRELVQPRSHWKARPRRINLTGSRCWLREVSQSNDRQIIFLMSGLDQPKFFMPQFIGSKNLFCGNNFFATLVHTFCT